MLIKNTSSSYGLVSKVLHWTIAFGMIGLIGLGWYMVGLSYFDKWYYRSLEFHKAFGLVVFAVGLVMVVWKFISPSPASHIELPAWQRIVAKSVQGLMILSVLMIPISGYLISTSAGKSIAMFGWFDVPAFVAVGSDLRTIAIAVHFYTAYATAVLILMHASAALKHQFVDKDGTLARMIWR